LASSADGGFCLRFRVSRCDCECAREGRGREDLRALGKKKEIAKGPIRVRFV
jgi:hypothetical protein